MTQSNTREAFEENTRRLAAGRPNDSTNYLERKPNGNYVNALVNAAWLSWQDCCSWQAATRAASTQAMGKQWKYCPECGCSEYKRADWNNENECTDCGQSWYPDIDYTRTVRAYLAQRKTQQSKGFGVFYKTFGTSGSTPIGGLMDAVKFYNEKIKNGYEAHIYDYYEEATPSPTSEQPRPVGDEKLPERESGEEAIELDKACATLNRRIKKAMKMLDEMIDGGEECRGRDSAISNIIYVLRGDTYYAE